MNKNQKKGYIMVLLAGMTWGTIGLFSTALSKMGMNASAAGFFRLLSAAVALAVILLIKGKGSGLFRISKRGLVSCLLVGAVSQALFNVCYLNTIEQCGMATGAVFLYTAPIYVALISAMFFHEPLTRNKIIAIIINIAGCVLTVTGGDFTTLKISRFGLIMGILAGFTYALLPVLSRTGADREDPVAAAFYGQTFGALILVFIIRPWNGTGAEYSTPLLLVIVGFGITSAMAYIFYYTGLSMVTETSKVPVLASVETVVAALIGLIAFGQSLGLGKIAGIALVLCSIAVMNRKTVLSGTAKRTACLLACIVLVNMISLQTTFAASPNGGIITDLMLGDNNYSTIVYNNSVGYPSPEANDIVQTSEGFIWIGSYSGLIRYDGRNFEVTDPSTGITSIGSLWVDKRDRLWIGTNDKGLALMENGKFRIWGEDEGLSSNKVNDIAESDDGTIYACTPSGVTMVTPDMKLVQVDDPRVKGEFIYGICSGSDGLVYCMSAESDLISLKDGKVVEYVSHKETSIQNITCIYQDPDQKGVLYVGTGEDKIYHGSLDQLRGKAEVFDISPLINVIEIKEIEGRLWVGTLTGIGMFDNNGFHDLSSLQFNNQITHLMEDYQGNLWFTSARQGLMKLVYNQFEDLQNVIGFEEAVVNSTCMVDGKLLIGTDGGLMVADSKGAVSELPISSAVTASGEDLGSTDLIELLDGVRIRSILRGRHGETWISTWRGPGLLRYKDGKVTAFNIAEGILSNQIRTVCEADDGSIYVACTGGVSVIKGDKVVRSYGKEDGIENTEPLSLCAAPNGDILAGSNGGGIYIIGKDGIRCVGVKDGLTSGVVMRIRYDSERDLYWLITGNAVAYMSSDYKITVVDKFPHNNNYDIFKNSKDEMWLTGSYGMCIVAADDLVKNNEMMPSDLGMANGLPCIATSNSYSEQTDSGDLYLSGTTGVVKVNIEEEREDVNNLRASVPYVLADGKRVYPDKDGEFMIGHKVKRLAVNPYVFTYSLTDPMVSYRLEGFDKESFAVRRSELSPVYYTNLKGGSYRFVMEIKDATGHTSKTVSVPIVKKKALYEYLWFYIAAGMLFLLLINCVEREYTKRRMAVLEKKHREEAERERVQNELTMANHIQSSMLSHNFTPMPGRDEFVLFASMDPAKEVGGDFYDFFPIDDDHLCLLIADVSGKGIPAALFMAKAKAVLQKYAAVGNSPDQILEKANKELCKDNAVKMFVTVWLGILEVSTGKLEAADGGHEYPAIRRGGGSFELFEDKHGVFLGAKRRLEYEKYELRLEPGDSIFLYTDGVPEAADPDYNMFGSDRMLDVLNSEPDADPEQMLGNVRKAVDEFIKGAEAFDDLTMLCLKYKGADGSDVSDADVDSTE